MSNEFRERRSDAGRLTESLGRMEPWPFTLENLNLIAPLGGAFILFFHVNVGLPEREPNLPADPEPEKIPPPAGDCHLCHLDDNV